MDADHFGLEKIKKRLIEYLAVVRLKEMNAVRENQSALVKTETAVDKTPLSSGDATNSPSKPTVEPPKPLARQTVKGPILL